MDTNTDHFTPPALRVQGNKTSIDNHMSGFNYEDSSFTIIMTASYSNERLPHYSRC